MSASSACTGDQGADWVCTDEPKSGAAVFESIIRAAFGGSREGYIICSLLL